jgi:hypothetical protein
VASGGLFTKLARHLPAGIVSAVLDRGEVEIRRGTVGPEEFVRARCDKLLETGVLGRIGG